MAIAFSSLLFSSSPAMNLLSFYTVFAVLFDTFIVRCFLVPSLFSILPELNWWPGSLWSSNKNIEVIEGQEMELVESESLLIDGNNSD